MEHYPKGVLHSLWVHSTIFILLSRYRMHTLLWPQTACSHSSPQDLSSPVLDHLASELQQFDIQFEHICRQEECSGWCYIPGSGPWAYTKTMTMTTLLQQMQWYGWKHHRWGSCCQICMQNSASNNMEKLNLDILWEEQQQDTFCIGKVEALRTK